MVEVPSDVVELLSREHVLLEEAIRRAARLWVKQRHLHRAYYGTHRDEIAEKRRAYERENTLLRRIRRLRFLPRYWSAEDADEAELSHGRRPTLRLIAMAAGVSEQGLRPLVDELLQMLSSDSRTMP
jgi:hypothetical protein